jgi:hypothetical protein
MWMSYVRVTTTCSDRTSILLQTQGSQPVLHEIGVSEFLSPSRDPQSPSASPSDCTVDVPERPAEPRDQAA